MSIQDSSAPDRVAGHLATGVLVDGDVVLIPGDFDFAGPVEALIFPAEPREDSRIDALDCWKLTAFSVHRPVAVAARLSHHSGYAAQAHDISGPMLASTLEENDGDLWRALIAMGAVDGAIREIPGDLLARVGEIETAQRIPRRTAHTFESYRQVTDGWCIFFCFCQPVKPQ